MQDQLVKIFQAAGLNFTGSMVKVAIGFVSKPVIAALISPELYGIFILGTTIGYMSNRIISMGIPGALSYFIPKLTVENKPGQIKSLVEFTLLLHLCASWLLYAVLFFGADILAQLFNEPQLAPVIRIVGISVPFMIITDDLANIFVGQEKAKPPIILRNFFLPIANISFIALLLLAGTGLWGISLGFTLAIAITGVIFFYLFVRDIWPKYEKADGRVSKRELFKYSLPLTFSEIIFLVLSYTDILMIGKILDSTEVAAFDVAESLSKILNLLPVAVLILYKPISAKLFTQKRFEDINAILHYISKWIVIVNVPLLCAFLILPTDVISLLFPEEYLIGVTALQLLTVGYFIATLFGPITQLFEPSGWQHKTTSFRIPRMQFII